jgi:hypothetical protein
LILGILILVAIIFVYRLVKWMCVGVKDIATDGSEIGRGAFRAGKWFGRSVHSGGKKVTKEWQKHNMTEKTGKAAVHVGKVALAGLWLGGKGLSWTGGKLWSKLRGVNRESGPQ